MWIQTNPNPVNNLTDDCVIRAISILLDADWLWVFDELVDIARFMYDVQISNNVWPKLLRREGFRRYILPDTCPDCYTVRHFCQDHQNGQYLLATGSHVIAVIDGDYYDTWDSGDEVPIYYFTK